MEDKRENKETLKERKKKTESHVTTSFNHNFTGVSSKIMPQKQRPQSDNLGFGLSLASNIAWR